MILVIRLRNNQLLSKMIIHLRKSIAEKESKFTYYNLMIEKC